MRRPPMLLEPALGGCDCGFDLGFDGFEEALGPLVTSLDESHLDRFW